MSSLRLATPTAGVNLSPVDCPDETLHDVTHVSFRKIRALRAVMRDRSLQAAAKNCFSLLLGYRSPAGTAWRPQELLADDVGLHGPRAVRRALAALVAGGHIVEAGRSRLNIVYYRFPQVDGVGHLIPASNLAPPGSAEPDPPALQSREELNLEFRSPLTPVAPARARATPVPAPARAPREKGPARRCADFDVESLAPSFEGVGASMGLTPIDIVEALTLAREHPSVTVYRGDGVEAGAVRTRLMQWLRVTAGQKRDRLARDARAGRQPISEELNRAPTDKERADARERSFKAPAAAPPTLAREERAQIFADDAPNALVPPTLRKAEHAPVATRAELEAAERKAALAELARLQPRDRASQRAVKGGSPAEQHYTETSVNRSARGSLSRSAKYTGPTAPLECAGGVRGGSADSAVDAPSGFATAPSVGPARPSGTRDSAVQ